MSIQTNKKLEGLSKRSDIVIKNDGTIDLATASSSKAVSWRNKEWLWSELIFRVSETQRSQEHFKEYLASKREVQDDIKNVGGFVGGYLDGGKRKAGSVLHRQLLTLDMDYGNKDMWGDFTFFFDCAAATYSTHKHCSENPRLRLIIPLDRQVDPDEFKAISRRVAQMVDIESFDHTTSYKPSQMMYWPSTSKDGLFEFEYQDGKWLSADDTLNSYVDWRDTSQWPTCSRENTVIAKELKVKGDPLEKPGVVGAFCRTYTIPDVIEKFLVDVYEPCDVENRYTFKEGSTSAGVVIYDNKYAYSHHGTDPASGELLNAFDLVRVHRFGLKDSDVKDATPINRRPSQLAMQAFATNDTEVRKQLAAEKRAEAKEDFAGADLNALEDSQEDDNEWQAEMDINAKGEYLTTVKNIRLILFNDSRIKGCIGYDELGQKTVVLKPLPWYKSKKVRPWNDDDWGMLRNFLGEKPYNLQRTPKLEDVMCHVRVSNSFHPIKDYFKTLSWDGKKRLDTLLIDYLGAANNEYTKEATRKTFVAVVARQFEPGKKFDYVLTIVGPQGIGKSTLIKKAGGDYHTDTFSFNALQRNTSAYEQIRGKTIVEIGEMTGFKKAEMDHVKNFIASQEDTYRPAYGREPVTFKRQCVFIGTTNNRDFLRDPTGNRRFWPIDTMVAPPTKDVFKDFTDSEIDQCWAEAYNLYKKGEVLRLSDAIEAEANRIQEEHSEYHEHAGVIEKYLNTLLPIGWKSLTPGQRNNYFMNADDPDAIQEKGTVRRERACIVEIWCEVFNGHTKDLNRLKAKELHDIMRKMEGWREYKTKMRFDNYGIQRAYERVK